MVNSKMIKGIAGVSMLFAAVAAHAQVPQTDTRTGTTPTTTRDASSNTQQQESRLQQGVLQSSTRQSGTQQSGLEGAGRFDKGTAESGVPQSGTTQAGTSQSGTTQAGATQAAGSESGTWAGSQKADPSTVPSTADRSRTAQDARSGITPETMTGRSGTAGMAEGGGAMNKYDTLAIKEMAMANMAEVEMGKMAQSKGMSEQVKSFGQQMVDDHGKALSEVQALAQAKGVTLPTELDAKHRQEADKLDGMSGAAFDKAYMDRAGVKDHKAVHAKLAKIEAAAKDPDVKAMAAKMMPVVKQHLNSAKQMGKTKTMSKPGTASGNG